MDDGKPVSEGYAHLLILTFQQTLMRHASNRFKGYRKYKVAKVEKLKIS
jgi:hypothetical protein